MGGARITGSARPRQSVAAGLRGQELLRQSWLRRRSNRTGSQSPVLPARRTTADIELRASRPAVCATSQYHAARGEAALLPENQLYGNGPVRRACVSKV